MEGIRVIGEVGMDHHDLLVPEANTTLCFPDTDHLSSDWVHAAPLKAGVGYDLVLPATSTVAAKGLFDRVAPALHVDINLASHADVLGSFDSDVGSDLSPGVVPCTPPCHPIHTPAYPRTASPSALARSTSSESDMSVDGLVTAVPAPLVPVVPSSPAVPEGLEGVPKHEVIYKLKPGHKPARGRRRRKQLATMSAMEIEAEKDARLEKNRQSARDCRLRKKSFIQGLEKKLRVAEVKEKEYVATIKRLREQLKREQVQVEQLRMRLGAM